jgi:hypothetical protein
MVKIALDFPIEDSSREPRGIEQGLLSPVFLSRSFPPLPSSSLRETSKLDDLIKLSI